MHVGMNIADKPALFAEARRVLKSGGVFAIYDVMRSGEGEFSFPVHWSLTPDTSFVVSAGEYRRALEAAGFELTKERNRREFALAFFHEVRRRAATAGSPPLAPVELICRAR